jgi:hypothetical protein
MLIDHGYKYIAIPVIIAWNWRGPAIIEFDAEGNILKLIELVNLESPMRAVYIDNRLTYSGTITYRLPELRYLRGISC